MVSHETDLALGLLIVSRGGLRLEYGGIRRFDLGKTPLEEVTRAVAADDFPWDEPKFGDMTTALTIGIEQPVTTLIFVLDPSLDAHFSKSPVQPGNELGKMAIRDVRLWPVKGAESAPRVVSLIADSRSLTGKGTVKFNLAVENVGEIGPERRPFRTPIIIDPDYPHPPTGGGTHGGFPWP